MKRYATMARRGMLTALIAAILLPPLAFASAGFCRAMPCCQPSGGEQVAIEQPAACCDAVTCAPAPESAREYSAAKLHQDVSAGTLQQALIPFIVRTPTPPPARAADSAPSPPQTLQRRMARLSILVV